MASRQDQLERAFTYWGEVCAIQEERCASSSISPALAGLERVDEPAQPTQPRPAASIPPQRFLGAVGALALRKEALAEREAMIVGRAARGRAAEGASTVKWAKVSSVSAAGALVCAATQSASALPAGAASVFQRYKAALAAGGELPLPFTANKVSGYLAVYCELWGQKSSSLKSVVTHLRGFADHFGFPWLSPSGETAVDKARLLLERANPCEISHAESIMDDKVELMLRVLDKAEAGNMWALSLAALISLAHDASTRLNEPTHALRKDVVVSDKGVYFRRYFDKGSKRFQDVRTQTSRASARPGSPLCVVARLRAYLACAKLGTDALLFPRREPATGAIVLDAAGAPALYSEHYYKRDFRAVAAAAGIANAASLSPRGLRSGGAMDDRLAGLSKAELDDKIGWGAKKKAQPLYVRGNEIGLELDRAARAGATRPRTH